MKGERIVIPEGRYEMNDVELRDWVVDIGHSAHQGVDANKRQLRVRLWFPGMDRAVEIEGRGAKRVNLVNFF